MKHLCRLFAGVLCALVVAASAAGQSSFVNFESPHVHPIDLSPDGNTLAVCNTPDNRVQLFDVSTGTPSPLVAIPVGLDPVSVRFRTDGELWVVNHLSDSVSVVDVATRSVMATLMAESPLAEDLYYDEPADVVFAGNPQRAFVSFSQSNVVAVYDPVDLGAAPTIVPINGEDPKAMAVSPDGSKVYVAIFESGNGTTLLGGGSDDHTVISFPPNAVSNPDGPYNGINPPPNNGSGFAPAMNKGLPTAPPVGLIVRKSANGEWLDENGMNWTNFISGPNARQLSGRKPGWDLIDNDVAIINTSNLSVSYAERIMNICMAIAVNPATGLVTVVGTDATNEIRFEPVINGKFIRVNMGFVENGQTSNVVDLNSHLNYTVTTASLSDRLKSIGDPRGVAWNEEGTEGYVVGMGSNNLIVVDANGSRVVDQAVDLPEGPTGVVFDATRNRVYVVSKFAAAVSAVEVATRTVAATVDFYDPSPEAIKVGRKHLYNTHETSGLGHVACASCHVDARTDRLAWDLGDPTGEVKLIDDDDTAQNLGMDFPLLVDEIEDWHPMKGPMSTQTLQDIIGQEPHHWRGDRDGLEEFNPAFTGLQGAPEMLTPEEMQEYEDFLATLHFPPNPFRNLDNTLRSSLPVGQMGHYSSGRFAGQGGKAEGEPLPAGNALAGLGVYRDPQRAIDQDAFSCVICHALPTGGGTNARIQGDLLSGQFIFVDQPPGPDGELHHTLVSVDGSTNKAIEVAQLRNVYEKVGCDFTQSESRSGFGFLHDGSVDSIARFVSLGAFDMANDQEVADMVALMLQFSGSDFPAAIGLPALFSPPGSPSQDAHAAVGKQVTAEDSLEALNPETETNRLINLFYDLAVEGKVGLTARHVKQGANRGYAFDPGSDMFECDSGDDTLSLPQLIGLAKAEAPITFTVVPRGSGMRIGVDRDEDGIRDYDEVRDLDPVAPGVQNPFKEDDPDVVGDDGALGPDGVPDGQNDFDGDGTDNATELANGTSPIPETAENPEDVDGSTVVDSVDLQLVINAALGQSSPPGVDADVDGSGAVDAVDVQLVINAILGM